MFREFVRQKLYEHSSSYTKTFMMLDGDRDGYVSALDITNFLQRKYVSTADTTQEEVEQWFQEYTSTPKRGLDMTQFALFLQDVFSLNKRLEDYRDLACKYQYLGYISDKQKDQIRQYFVQHMCSLGCNFQQYYKLLCGGKGYLYEHQVRNIVERCEDRQLLDEEWGGIYAIIKTDKRCNHVSPRELEAFMLGERPQPICVHEEEDSEDLDLRNPVGGSQAESGGDDLADQGAPAEGPARWEVKTCKQRESRDDSDILVTAGQQGHSRSPRILRLKIAPRPRTAPLSTSQSTAIEGSDFGLFNLLSEKISQTGRPRDVFKKFDQYKTQKVSFRVFSAQLQLLYGIAIEPRRLKETLQNILEIKEIPYVTYDVFQKFYNIEQIVAKHSKNTNASSALRGERRNFVYGKQGAQEPDGELVDKLVQEQKQLIRIKKEDAGQDRPEISIDKEPPVVGKPKKKQQALATTSQVNECTTKTVNEVVTTTTQANQNRIKMEVKINFVNHVKKLLNNRGISFIQLLRETFPGQRTISNKDLVWFFRNKVGVSYSPELIITVCGQPEGPVDVATVGSIFKAGARADSK